jgi:hypothetical protein
LVTAVIPPAPSVSAGSSSDFSQPEKDCESGTDAEPECRDREAEHREGVAEAPARATVRCAQRAEGNTAERRDQRRTDDERERHRQPLIELRNNRLLVQQGQSEIAANGLLQPIPVLNPDRMVEAELAVERSVAGRGRARAEDVDGGIAGCQPDEHERDERHHEHERHREHQPTGDQPSIGRAQDARVARRSSA